VIVEVKRSVLLLAGPSSTPVIRPGHTGALSHRAL